MKTKMFPLILWLLMHSSFKGGANGKSRLYYSRYQPPLADAHVDCQHVGGHLVKIDGPEEYDLIINNYPNWPVMSSNFWTGLSDEEVDGDYKWTDGSPLGWVKWAPGQPDAATEDENYVFIASNQGLHTRSGNRAHISFICEVEDTPEALARADILSCWIGNDLLRGVLQEDSDVEIKCPRNKIYFSPSHDNNHKTWPEAKAFCEEANATLAKITTEDEQHIVERFRRFYSQSPFWIGGTDEDVEGTFTWTDGTAMVWPDFALRPKPSVSTGLNCVANTWRKNWLVYDCLTRYAILCEMDADLLPVSEACYWSVPANTWPNVSLACQSGGGTLATLRSARQYEKARSSVFRSIGLSIFLGMSDTEKTYDFRWIDGSLMTWSFWYIREPKQPNHGNGFEPYGAVDHSYMYFDWGTDIEFPGLCQKPVASFRNADVLNTLGSIEVVCRESCRFLDGTSSRTWTCGADLPQQYEGCICTRDWTKTWTIQEPWLSDLSISNLFDNDTASCFNFAGVTKILTLQHIARLRQHFTVHVILPEDLESHRDHVIGVLTSEYHDESLNSCSKARDFKKCLHVDGHSYTCYCEYRCELSIKLFFIGQWVGVNTPLSVCEIRIL